MMNRFEKITVGGHLVEKLSDAYLKENFCEVAKILSNQMDMMDEEFSKKSCLHAPIRYRKVIINLKSDYEWGNGWKSQQSATAFEREIIRIFRQAEWKIQIPSDKSTCIIVSRCGQSLYCHGMSFEGNIYENNLEKIIQIVDGIDHSVATIAGIRLLGDQYNMKPSQLTKILFSEKVSNLIAWWILLRTDGMKDTVPACDKNRPPYSVNELVSDLHTLFQGTASLDCYWTLEEFIRGMYGMLIKVGDLKLSEKLAPTRDGETYIRKFRMKKDKYKLITPDFVK